MMKKAKSYKPDYYASCAVSDNFGSVWNSMLKHKAFQDLSNSAKVLYICCRVQAQSEEGRRALYKHNEEAGKNYKSDRYFVFPSTHLERYGLTPSNQRKNFKELNKSGFIEYAERNGHRRKENVYAFSAKWKNS